MKSINFQELPQMLTIGGAYWGDEGKGKIADWLLRHYDIVVRFSGGGNAGHTVFTEDGRKVVSHAIPCGLALGKTCVMGPGEFFDLYGFIKEREDAIKILGDSLPDIWIDRNCPLFTPYHGLFEAYLEWVRKTEKINTTGKGIGPLAGFSALRIGLVVSDLFAGKDDLTKKVTLLFDSIRPCLEEMARNKAEIEIPEVSEVVNSLQFNAGLIESQVIDTSLFLYRAVLDGKRILVEGAQAIGLDKTFGTQPFVSSGNSVIHGASLGTGLHPGLFLDSVLVAKLLPTRVGAGPFPSEIFDRDRMELFPKQFDYLFNSEQDHYQMREKWLSERLLRINAGTVSNFEISQYFQVLGDERGATTNRGRSVGWMDLAWLRYSIRLTQPRAIALTRFDMLSGLLEVPVVVEYELDDCLVEHGAIPLTRDLCRVMTIIEKFPGWAKDISGYSSWAELPDEAREFIELIEKLLGVKIAMIGTGPGPQDIIIR